MSVGEAYDSQAQIGRGAPESRVVDQRDAGNKILPPPQFLDRGLFVIKVLFRDHRENRVGAVHVAWKEASCQLAIGDEVRQGRNESRYNNRQPVDGATLAQQ